MSSLNEGWGWVRINAGALTVVGAFIGGLTGGVWYLGTTMATTIDVDQVEVKVDDLSAKVEPLATTTDINQVEAKVDDLNAKVDQLQVTFSLMMSCIIEQNRQTVALVARRQPAPAPPLPASCETALELVRTSVTSQ